MKTLGLIGGMSWRSTLPYYELINEEVGHRLGGHHAARLLLWSVDFEPIQALQHEGRWEDIGAILAEAAGRLEDGGAELLVLCTNTMHLVSGAIEERAGIPLLHIADATAAAIEAAGLDRVALIGTRFTMDAPFYVERLRDRHGVEAVIPDEAGRAEIHRIIFDELCQGQVLRSSQGSARAVLAPLIEAGCQGVVLGCTELGLLLGDLDDLGVPVFDTTRVHALAAVDAALASTSPHCEVHGLALLRGTARVLSGLATPSDPAYPQARATLFPQAHLYLEGGRAGATVWPERRVRYCSACRGAELRWRRDNP